MNDPMNDPNLPRRKVWPWVVCSLTVGFVFGVGVAGAASTGASTASAADRPATTRTVTLPAPPPETVVVTPEPEVPAGPAQTFGNGKYEVGVDVAPGKYKTTGGSGTCYYAFLDGAGSDAEILDNHLGQGPQTVTLKSGSYFESSRCGTWEKVG